MLAIIKSATLRGIDAVEITVEIDAAHGGLPGEAMVGLPDTVVRESKNRIKSAIKNSGLKYPLKFYTINLAPAELPKEGPFFDVPIAVGILQATEQAPLLENVLFVGELSLNGDVKPIRGAISICHMAAQKGYTHVVLPFENYNEARWISAITPIPVKNLAEIKAFLEGTFEIPPPPETPVVITPLMEDFSEVKGQLAAKRVMEIVAAGHHNALLIGSPGSGKTMLLKRLPSIMPDLSVTEAIETFKIRSISLKNDGDGFTLQRPFRQPHHSISYAGLVGGGARPQPGEISLAHRGILFLDELPEFPRHVIEVLRQPLEEKRVVLSRASGSICYPADSLFVSAMNPCPCGYHGDPKIACTCPRDHMKRYWKKISGPILDRIDLVVFVERLTKMDLTEDLPVPDNPYTSSKMKTRVLQSRDRQEQRGPRLNSGLTSQEIKQFCGISKEIQVFLGQMIDRGFLSGRSYVRVLKVARTIADLAGSESISLAHVTEASHYRRGAHLFE